MEKKREKVTRCPWCKNELLVRVDDNSIEVLCEETFKFLESWAVIGRHLVAMIDSGLLAEEEASDLALQFQKAGRIWRQDLRTAIGLAREVQEYLIEKVKSRR